ncbi:outer membrane lipoprotein-sorting protein [Nitrosomonas sp.]|uniref:outer membrane lipoprotein-sorting protein n=1 Tax=Nitrosomonas sp. TaxID=42353 RepID=UPI0025EAEF03|nr:outer membrane lipoprotein-sorting protein [Nitrosomonas sp.]MCC6917089.1 outer membrane lipoprotein-sorting protein [Nitrosomonas sp.]
MNLHSLLFSLATGFSLLIHGGISLSSPPPAEQTGITAQSILEKADEIRFPRGSFQVNVAIRTTSPDHSEDHYQYQVLSRGNENSIVRITEPASERGQVILMKGRDLWVFMPSVSQPVRLSLSQRLTGQVANGDIARANFTGDYHPQLLRTESINGENCYVLELTGIDRSVTYQKVLLWVNQSSFRPYKAEFYSVSGRLLKTSRYENFDTILGEMRPTRIIMEDALKSGEVSVLDYSDMKLRDLPDKLFTKDYLKRLE